VLQSASCDLQSAYFNCNLQTWRGCPHLWGFVTLSSLLLGDASPLDDSNEHDDYCYGKQDVNEPT